MTISDRTTAARHAPAPNGTRPPAPNPAGESDVAPPIAPAPTRRVAAIGVGLGVLLAGALAVAIVPRLAQQKTLDAGAVVASDSTPTVSVTAATRASPVTSLTLPGTLQGVREAAIYAQAAGYVSHVYVNIGTPVRQGQLLAVIAAPELTQSVQQGRAQLAQQNAALVLARNTYQRWQVLADSGAATPQDLDQYRSAYTAAQATAAAAQDNVQRLSGLQGYTRVTAPFAGVVTARGVDEGAYVGTAGSTSAGLASGGTLTPAQATSQTSLFRIAQADTLRVYVSVPQNLATSIRVGLSAELLAPNATGTSVLGRVVRSARAIDPASRTLLTEIDVPNRQSLLMPGMFAEALLRFDRRTPPLTVPATALVVRTAGPELVVVDSLRPGRGPAAHAAAPTTAGAAAARDTTGVLRYVAVQVGRDYGATIEIARGLAEGATVVLNPADGLRTGQRAYVVTTPPPSDGLTPPSATGAAKPASPNGQPAPPAPPARPAAAARGAPRL